MMKYVSLNDVCYKITDGSHNPPSGGDKGLPMLSSRNIIETGLTLDGARYLSKQDFDRENKRTNIEPGDILLTIVGTVGRVYVVKDSDSKFTIQRSVGVLKPKIEMITSNFLGCLIKSDNFQRQLTEGAKGVAQKGIYLNDIKKLLIPLPPLAEQKRIADLLDAADHLRQKDKALLEKYDQLAQSLFLEMFGDPVKNEKGWEKIELSQLVSKLGDGLHGTPNYDENGEYYFVNGNNLINGDIVFSTSTKKVNQTEYSRHKKELNETSILVSINGTIGKTAIYKNEKIILGKSACYFNIQPEKLNKTFILTLVSSDYFLKYATDASTGSTIKNVSLKTMRDFPVLLPPISLQNQFAEQVQLIEKQKELAKENLKKSEELFGSLMGEVFK